MDYAKKAKIFHSTREGVNPNIVVSGHVVCRRKRNRAAENPSPERERRLKPFQNARLGPLDEDDRLLLAGQPRFRGSSDQDPRHALINLHGSDLQHPRHTYDDFRIVNTIRRSVVHIQDPSNSDNNLRGFYPSVGPLYDPVDPRYSVNNWKRHQSPTYPASHFSISQPSPGSNGPILQLVLEASAVMNGQPRKAIHPDLIQRLQDKHGGAPAESLRVITQGQVVAIDNIIAKKNRAIRDLQSRVQELQFNNSALKKQLSMAVSRRYC